MKYAFGILTALVFAATMAMAAQNLPFPQAANPALQSGNIVPLVVNQGYNTGVPAAMAANQAGATEDSVLSWQPASGIALGSPFPAAANPARGNGNGMAPEGHRSLNTGSPFPASANPSEER